MSPNQTVPRVSSACGKGFELYFWRVPVPAWAEASYSNSQQATGIPQNFNSKPFPQADETRGTIIIQNLLLKYTTVSQNLLV